MAKQNSCFPACPDLEEMDLFLSSEADAGGVSAFLERKAHLWLTSGPVILGGVRMLLHIYIHVPLSPDVHVGMGKTTSSSKSTAPPYRTVLLDGERPY